MRIGFKLLFLLLPLLPALFPTTSAFCDIPNHYNVNSVVNPLPTQGVSNFFDWMNFLGRSQLILGTRHHFGANGTSVPTESYVWHNGLTTFLPMPPVGGFDPQIGDGNELVIGYNCLPGQACYLYRATIPMLAAIKRGNGFEYRTIAQPPLPAGFSAGTHEIVGSTLGRDREMVSNYRWTQGTNFGVREIYRWRDVFGSPERILATDNRCAQADATNGRGIILVGMTPNSLPPGTNCNLSHPPLRAYLIDHDRAVPMPYQDLSGPIVWWQYVTKRGEIIGVRQPFQQSSHGIAIYSRGRVRFFSAPDPGRFLNLEIKGVYHEHLALVSASEWVDSSRLVTFLVDLNTGVFKDLRTLVSGQFAGTPFAININHRGQILMQGTYQGTQGFFLLTPR